MVKSREIREKIMHLSRNELLLHCNWYFKGCQYCFKFSHNSSSIHIIYSLSLSPSVPSFLPFILCWIIIWCTAIYCIACYSMIRKLRATWRWTLCSVLKTHFDPMWRKRWVRHNYINIHTSVYLYMYLYMYLCISTCICMCIYINIHTSVYLYMYMNVYIYAYTDTSIYIHLYICTCICMYIYAYTDT